MGVRTTRRVLLRGGAGASLAALAACSGDEQSGASPDPSAAPSTTDERTGQCNAHPDPHSHRADPDADPVGRAEAEGRRRGGHRARGPVGDRVPAGRHGAGRRARHRPAAPRVRWQRRRRRDTRRAQPGRRGRRDRAARDRAASRVRDEPAPLRLPVHRRRQPHRPDDLRRHPRKAGPDPHRHRHLDPPQRWRPGLRPGRAALRRHGRCRELGQRPGHRLGRRQGAADDRRGPRPRREPVRQPDLELRPPQRRRASASTTPAGCGPRSSATRAPTSST